MDMLWGGCGDARRSCDDACNTHLLTTDTYTGSGYLIGVAYMAQWSYPDIFTDLSPYSIPQYLERFRGMEMPDRIFVYPASKP